MKVLNLLLAAAMVSSAVVMPVHNETASAAGNVEEIIYQTNFDDISSLSDLTGDAGSKTGWGYYYVEGSYKTGDKYGFDGSKYIDVIDEGGNKYLYTYQTASQNGKENALYYDTSAIASGSIVADYDIKFDVENLVNMRIGYGMRADTMVTENGEVYNGYWQSNADNKILLASSGTISADKWYHVTLTADFDSDTMDVLIVDRDTNSEIVNEQLTGLGDTSVTRALGINTINYASGGSEKQGAYIDNVTIKHVTDAAEPDPEPTPVPTGGPAELPMSETFDYDSIADMEAAGWFWRGEGEKISKIEDGVFYLGLQAGADNYEAKRKIEPVTSGILTAEYDVTPAQGVIAYNYFWGEGSGTLKALFFNTDGKIYFNGNPGSTVLGTYTPGQTYHCKVVVDIDNDTLDITVTDSENQVVGTRSGSCAVSRIEELTFQTWSKPAEDTWVAFDNLTVAVEETPVVTPDPTYEEVIYENNFDDVENLNDLDGKEGDGWNSDIGGRKDGLGTDGAIMLLEDEGNKYLYVHHTADTFEDGDTVSMSYDYPSVTSGQVIYDFDIMTDRTNMTFIRFGYGAHMDNSIMANGELYNSYWTADKLKLTNNTIAANKWYHAVITADLTSDFSTVYIEDKETGEVVVDVDIPTIGNHNLTRFTIDCTDTAKVNVGGAYLDNLKITKTNKPATEPRPMPELEFRFDENFDSYADLDAMQANGWTISNGYSTSKPGPNSEDSALVGDTDKSFYLGIDNNTDNIQAIKSFDTSISQGKARMEFDITPGADTLTYIWMSGTGDGASSNWSPNRISLFVFNGGQVGIGGNDISRCRVVGNYTAGQKYRCSIVIDIENDTLTAEIENEDGSRVGSETLGYKDHAGTDIFSLTGLTLQEWGATKNTGSTFDNIVITKLPEDAPTVSISNTAFVTDGEESHNYKEVSTLTDSIAINFGAVMDPETLTGIKIVKADDSEAAYTAEVSGNVVNLNLTNTLAPNTEYTIIIPAEAANINGTTLGEEARMVFNTVDDAVLSGAIKALTVDGNAVTNISQIKTGTTLAADVKLDNATSADERAVVIFSFYDADGRFVGTNYDVIELDAGAKFNDTVEYTVGDMADVKTVKVMLWDGFERMIPLDGCTTIE